MRLLFTYNRCVDDGMYASVVILLLLSESVCRCVNASSSGVSVCMRRASNMSVVNSEHRNCVSCTCDERDSDDDDGDSGVARVVAV